MAIDNANSNFVNINSLPQAQEAIDSDLLILQTENGTQTITFENFNVLKTEPNGNAVLPGTLSGSTANFSSLTASQLVATQYRTSTSQGTSVAPSFCNYFTIDNGIVVAAENSLSASPDYLNIVNNVLPGMSAYQNTVYKRVVFENGFYLYGGNEEYTTVTIAGFFSKYPVTISQINIPSNFSIMLSTSAQTVPYINNIVRPIGTNNLTFDMHLGSAVSLVGPFPTAYWRLLYFY